MTQWGLDVLFNPAKRHMDEEKQRLQSTREEVGDASDGKRIDLASGKVVASIKKGRGFVSSGPIIELDFFEGGHVARPGDEVAPKPGAPLAGKLRVRAAPWIDVSSVGIAFNSSNQSGVSETP